MTSAQSKARPQAAQPSRLLKKSMTHEFSDAIPPTQLVVRSYFAYRAGPIDTFSNSTNAVGGSFISDLA